jgi:cell division protein FtsQ
MDTKYYNEDINTDKKQTPGKIEKGLKRLLIAAAVILVMQLLWLFGVSPFIPFSAVEVHDFSSLHRAEILALAGLNENSSYFSTNTKDIQEKLSKHILVESAVVMKRFPDRLSIFINPRQAAAVTITNVNSKQVPVFVDRKGVYFKYGEIGSHETMDLPVLSGVDNPQLNMRLPSSLVTLVENLNKMSISSPELLSAISEIRIERKSWDGFDLVLFPVHSSIKVRVENDLNEETLRYMLLMLNVFEANAEKPEEIDFRSGMGSYKMKEQSL